VWASRAEDREDLGKMSLQRRLTLFFVLIVILPLGVAGFAVQRVVVNEISRRAVLSLAPALDATVALYRDRVEALDARVRGTVGLSRFSEVLSTGTTEEVGTFLTGRLDSSSNLDFFIAFDRKGRRIAYTSVEGDFVAPTISRRPRGPDPDSSRPLGYHCGSAAAASPAAS
jgi:hypothetical protein